MKVITNQGEYATVTKEMSNHYEIRCDNGVTKMIEKRRCEELVPKSQVDQANKELYRVQQKAVKVATAIHELHFELGKNIDLLESKSKLSDVLLADLHRSTRVKEDLEEILSL